MNGRPRDHTKSKAAKWVVPKTGEPPPAAFMVPITEADQEMMQAAPEAEAGQKFVMEWGKAEFDARYAGALALFEEEERISRERVVDIDKEIERCTRIRDETEQWLVKRVSVFQYPKGLLRTWLVFISFVLCFLTCLEWYNAASFVARFELQDIVAGLGFTLGLGLAPVALELILGERRFMKRIILLSLLLVTLLGFTHVFSDSYLASDQHVSTEEILDQGINSVAPFPFFWRQPLHTHWRFMWQMMLFILIGISFSNYLKNHINLTETCEGSQNPVYVALQRHLEQVVKERERWGNRLAEAEGNRLEWRASLQSHVQRCLCLFELEAFRKKHIKELQQFLENRVQRGKR